MAASLDHGQWYLSLGGRLFHYPNYITHIFMTILPPTQENNNNPPPPPPPMLVLYQNNFGSSMFIHIIHIVLWSINSKMNYYLSHYMGTWHWQWRFSIMYKHHGACRGLIHWGRDRMISLSQTVFLYALSSMQMVAFRSISHWNLFCSLVLN